MSPRPKAKAKIATFVPHTVVRHVRNTNLELDLEFHERVKEKARKYDMSMKNFMTQAIAFAVDNMDEDTAN